MFEMNNNLFLQGLSKFLAGLVIVMVLLFIPAGTFAYWQAWLFIGVLFVPMFLFGLVLMKRNPDLLRKRLSAKEKESEQKRVVAISGVMFVAISPDASPVSNSSTSMALSKSCRRSAVVMIYAAWLSVRMCWIRSVGYSGSQGI